MRRCAWSFLFVLAMTAAQACKDGPAAPRQITGIDILVAEQDFVIGSGVTIFVARGETLQLAASARLSDGSKVDITTTALWSTDNPSAVGVNATGVVTGGAPGLARIKAALNGFEGSARVGVQTP